MARSNGNQSAVPGKSGSPLLGGILLGVLVGVGLAAGVTWYIMKSPSPFVQKEQKPANPPTEAAKPDSSTATATPGQKPATVAPAENDGKPRFEFYTTLTEKQNPNAAPDKHAEKPKLADKAKPPVNKPNPIAGKPAAAYEPQILQAGSFPKADDAEKLKAKLAMLGVEAKIQSANIPDKGVWYRVRLGPYKNEAELNHARGFLKQNGVDSTPMHAQ